MAAARARRELLQELQKERAVGFAAHLFGEPRLERFLQGNEGSVAEAAAHFRRMLAWREEAKMVERRPMVEGKSWGPDAVPGLRRLLDIMACDVEGYTEEGELIWMQCDGLARLSRLGEISDDDLYSTFFLMAELRQDHLDRLSAERGSLARVVQIRDLSGFSVTGLLRDRTIMARLREVLRVANLAYPETVSRIILLNLPAGFNLLWAALQPLLNARVRKKFRFLSSEDPVAELAALAGNRSLQALARARHRALGISDTQSVGLEICAGMSEYACQRMESGDSVQWGFEVSPKAGSSGLQFSVVFFADADCSQPKHVRTAVAAKDGAVGTYCTAEPGLLWLTWSNPGAFSRTRRIERLRLVLQPAQLAQAAIRGRGSATIISAGAASSAPGGLRRSTEQQRAQLRGCGCFDILSLPGRPSSSELSSRSSRSRTTMASPTPSASLSSSPSPAQAWSSRGSSGVPPSAEKPGSRTLQIATAMLLALALTVRFFQIFQEQITDAVRL